MVEYQLHKEIRRTLLAYHRDHKRHDYNFLVNISREVAGKDYYDLLSRFYRVGLAFRYFAPEGVKEIPFGGYLISIELFEKVNN